MISVLPFFVIKNRLTATSTCITEQPDTVCKYKNREVNFTDTSFASCLKFNHVLHQRYNYSNDPLVRSDDHLICCNGTKAEDSCKERNVFTERLVDDDNIAHVILDENSNINFDRSSETLFTCECNYGDAYMKYSSDKVLVGYLST